MIVKIAPLDKSKCYDWQLNSNNLARMQMIQKILPIIFGMALSIPHTFYIIGMEKSTEKHLPSAIRVLSSDGIEHTLPTSLAKLSKTLKQFIEDDTDLTSPFTIGIDDKTLSTIIKCLGIIETNGNTLPNQEALYSFLETTHYKHLIDLYKAANYLDVCVLLDAVSKELTDQLIKADKDTLKELVQLLIKLPKELREKIISRMNLIKGYPSFECPIKVKYAHKGDLTSLIVSSDGQYALTSSNDGRVCFRSLIDNELITTLKLKHKVAQIAMSPNNEYCITATDDTASNDVTLWNLTDKEALADLNVMDRYAIGITFADNGQSALIASPHSIQQYDIPSGSFVGEFGMNFSRDFEGTPEIVFSPNGKYIITIPHGYLASGPTQLWSIEKRECITTLIGEQKITGKQVNAAAISPDNKYILIGYKGKNDLDRYKIELWTLSPSIKCIKTLNISKHSMYVIDSAHLTFSNDSKYALSASGVVAVLWSIPQGELVEIIEPADSTYDSLDLAALCLNNRCALIGSTFHKTLRLWPMQELELTLLQEVIVLRATCKCLQPLLEDSYFKEAFESLPIEIQKIIYQEA